MRICHTPTTWEAPHHSFTPCQAPVRYHIHSPKLPSICFESFLPIHHLPRHTFHNCRWFGEGEFLVTEYFILFLKLFSLKLEELLFNSFQENYDLRKKRLKSATIVPQHTCECLWVLCFVWEWVPAHNPGGLVSFVSVRSQMSNSGTQWHITALVLFLCQFLAQGWVMSSSDSWPTTPQRKCGLLGLSPISFCGRKCCTNIIFLCTCALYSGFHNRSDQEPLAVFECEVYVYTWEG